ncbi:transketolase family protein [Oerskovia sp. NPDC060338]|uniref:transketolase family protein n=1 Tax=Oerskovia sp. NPDC060338 TaxID=3347100 RepID=UPI00365979B2
MRPAVSATLAQLGHETDELVVLAADGRALALSFAAVFPERFVDVGIAEANLMGVAAGLARSGRRVVVCGMAPFLVRRAAEQLRLDICGPGLDVTILGVGGGLGYGDLGASHHAPEDLGSLASMPGMRVFCPADIHDARWSVRQAVALRGPAYVRLGAREDVVVHQADEEFSSAGTLRGGLSYDVLIIAAGATVGQALEAARSARLQGVDVAVLDLAQVYPFPADSVQEAARRARRVVTVEEHLATSGIAAQTALVLAGQWHGDFVPLAIDRRPAPSVGREELFAYYRIDTAAVLDAVMTGETGGRG